MLNSKKNPTRNNLQVNNYDVVFDVVQLLESINNLGSRVARLERQIKELNGSGKNGK